MEYGDITTKWGDIESCDVAFMQRPHIHYQLETMRYIQEMGKPVVLDYDDDLFHVVPANPHYMAFKDERTKDTVKNLITEAQLVIVSTEHLRSQYATLNKNVKVVRNGFNADMFKYAKTRYTQRSKCVVWRGGNGHGYDLEYFRKPILHFVNDYKQFIWVFMGYYPGYLPEESESLRSLFFLDPVKYHKNYYDLRPKLAYVPLEDTIFNRSKSNVSYIEATFAGAVCVVPDFDEFKCPGALVYKSVQEFQNLIESVLKPDFPVHEYNKKAWNHITGEQSLNVLNEKRYKLIKELV